MAQEPPVRTTRAEQIALLRDDLAHPWDLRRLSVPVMRRAIPIGHVTLPEPESVQRAGRELRRPGETVLALDIDTDPTFVVAVAERAWDFMERHGLPWQQRSTTVLIDPSDVSKGRAQRAPQWHVDSQRTTGTPNFQFLVGTVLPTVVARTAPPGDVWLANGTISDSVREWRDWHPKAVTRLQPGTLYCTTGYTVHRGARAPRALSRLFGGLAFPDNVASAMRTDDPAFTYDVTTRTLTDHRTPLLCSLMRVVRVTSAPFAQVVDATTGVATANYHDPAHLLDKSPAAGVLSELRQRAIESHSVVRFNEIAAPLDGGGALAGVCIQPLIADGRVVATAELLSDRTLKRFSRDDADALTRSTPDLLSSLARCARPTRATIVAANALD